MVGPPPCLLHKVLTPGTWQPFLQGWGQWPHGPGDVRTAPATCMHVLWTRRCLGVLGCASVVLSGSPLETPFRLTSNVEPQTELPTCSPAVFTKPVPEGLCAVSGAPTRTPRVGTRPWGAAQRGALCTGAGGCEGRGRLPRWWAPVCPHGKASLLGRSRPRALRPWACRGPRDPAR